MVRDHDEPQVLEHRLPPIDLSQDDVSGDPAHRLDLLAGGIGLHVLSDKAQAVPQLETGFQCPNNCGPLRLYQ